MTLCRKNHIAIVFSIEILIYKKKMLNAYYVLHSRHFLKVKSTNITVKKNRILW